jgi:hypothetical protein
MTIQEVLSIVIVSLAITAMKQAAFTMSVMHFLPSLRCVQTSIKQIQYFSTCLADQASQGIDTLLNKIRT